MAFKKRASMDLFKVKSCPFEGEKRRGSGGLEESSGTEPESPGASFRGLELLVARGTSTRTMGQRHCLAPRRYIK